MKKNLLKVLLFIFIIAYIGSVRAENDKAFFWEVSSSNPKHAIVYLMGSIHFADKSFYPLRKEMEQAFDKSDALVVELDISKTDHQVYNELLARRGIYKDGRTIKDVVSEETWLQLRQRLRYLNVPYDSIKNYKPGILVLTLSALQVIKMGFDPELGIDAYFLQKAAHQNMAATGKLKQVIELETLEKQLNLFLNIPNGELLLKESLYSLDEAELLMAEMVRNWKKGDDEQMNKLLFEDALTEYPAFSAIYDSLFYERNQQMTVKIDQMLKQQGKYFVVVGSGHLIGDKGIVSKLRDKGYIVKRL